MTSDCCAQWASAPWCATCYSDLCACEGQAGHDCDDRVVFWTDRARLSALWRGERLIVELWRPAARGWVGTGALCGTRGQVLGWLADDRHWPDAAPFLPRLRAWLDRTRPSGQHVA